MGYNWKKRLGEELKTEKNVRDCGGLERTLQPYGRPVGKETYGKEPVLGNSFCCSLSLPDGRYGFSRRRCLRRWAACFQGYTGILTE